MSYEAYTLDDFGGGLNLKDKADAIAPNEAVEATDVVFTETGAVQSRPGYEIFTSSTLTNPVDSLHPFYTTSGTKQLLAGCGTRLEALNTSGGVVASLTGLTATGGTSGPWYWDFCRVGTASAEYAYAGNGENVLKRWDGSSWSSIANTPQGGALCVTPSSNRLVVARFKGTAGGPTGGAGTSNPSRVYFSDPGAPETWTSTNYIDLDPGDGEVIQAAITWREYVFVFKETKFYVFTGESTDADGNPVFNYRKIDTGVGACAPRGVAADENGVYFIHLTGVYVTTGEAPVKISEKIDTVFTGTSPPYYDPGYLVTSTAYRCGLGVWQGKVLVGMPVNGSGTRNFVYDTRDQWWTIWALGGRAHFSTFRISDIEELVFGNGANVGEVLSMDGSLTTDLGTTIVGGTWRSGFMDLGNPDVKRLRQIKVWGSGALEISATVDYPTATGTSTALTFTGGYNLNPALYRLGTRGTLFSIYLTGNVGDNTEFSVSRMTLHTATPRQVTVLKADR